MHINISSKTTHSQITVNMPSFLSFLLILLNILLLLNGTVQSNDCSTEGFMELSLLEAKTATNNNGQTTAGLAESVETRWIITEEDKQFSDNCSGFTLTEVLVGVDIRTETGNRNQYPRIEIWEQIKRYYIDPVSIELILSPYNFTTNGLYRYALPTPLNFRTKFRGYRLGVRQPRDDRSVVRFYKVNGTGQIGRVAENDDFIRKDPEDGQIVLQNSSILIHPITSISLMK